MEEALLEGQTKLRYTAFLLDDLDTSFQRQTTEPKGLTSLIVCHVLKLHLLVPATFQVLNILILLDKICTRYFWY
jgi:hypothetical protein